MKQKIKFDTIFLELLFNDFSNTKTAEDSGDLNAMVTPNMYPR